jgi:hypothetical protein
MTPMNSKMRETVFGEAPTRRFTDLSSVSSVSSVAHDLGREERLAA